MSRFPRPFEWGLAGLAGAIAAVTPIARTLGYESAMILAIVGGLLALRRGLVAGRALRHGEQRVLQSGGAPIASADETRAVRRQAGEAFASATLASVIALTLPWAMLVVSTRVFQGCRSGPGSLLVLFLALPAAAHCAAVGLLAGAVTRRRWTAGSLLVLIAVANGIHSALQALSGRTIPHSLPFGFLSGSGWGGVGSAELDLPSSFFLLRGLAVAICPLLVAVAALAGARARRFTEAVSGPEMRTIPRAAAPLGGLILAAVPVAAAALFPSAFGLTMGASARSAELAAWTRTDHLVVRFTPGGRAEPTAPRLAADAEWDFQVDAAIMNLAAANPVTVWVYDDAEQMRRLTGADQFLFALPWRREVHTLWTPEGASELRHELVHVLASDWSHRPLRISWNQALLEGTAEAVASYAFLGGEFQKEAAAALAAGRLTPAMRLFGTTGFVWGDQSLRNAYRLSASFVGFLLENFGPAPLALAYGGSSWKQAYGMDIAALDARWREELSRAPISPEERRRAAAAFDPARHPSFHLTRCPRVGEANPSGQDAEERASALPENDAAGEAARVRARGLAVAATRSGRASEQRAAAARLFRAGLPEEAIKFLNGLPGREDWSGPPIGSSGGAGLAAASPPLRPCPPGPSSVAARPELGDMLVLLLFSTGRLDQAGCLLDTLQGDSTGGGWELYRMLQRSAAVSQIADALLLNVGAGATGPAEAAARRRQRELLRAALRREPDGPAAWIAAEMLCAWPPAGSGGAGERLLERFLDGAGREGGERAARAALRLAAESFAKGRRVEAARLFASAQKATRDPRKVIQAAEGRARAEGKTGADFVRSVLPSLVAPDGRVATP